MKIKNRWYILGAVDNDSPLEYVKSYEDDIPAFFLNRKEAEDTVKVLKKTNTGVFYLLYVDEVDD